MESELLFLIRTRFCSLSLGEADVGEDDPATGGDEVVRGSSSEEFSGKQEVCVELGFYKTYMDIGRLHGAAALK